MTNTAELTFPDRDSAKAFASRWAAKTSTGYDMSRTDHNGEVVVTVYDVDNEREEFIDKFISDWESNGGKV